MPRCKILPESFFQDKTAKVARALLGKYLVVKQGGSSLSGKINEVEIYAGFEDKASHASRGPTERNKVMFAAGGRIYVYLCYGIHWMLNIVTESEGYPAAILIRGVGQWNGPGKLTKAFNIDKNFNGKKLDLKNNLWIEDRGGKITPSKIVKSPRIGVDYAGPVWSQKLYRFTLVKND